MVTSGLVVRVEAKPGRGDDVEAMFKAVVDRVRDEGLAVAWFALRLGPTSFCIVDVFTSDADRDAHLAANGPALQAAGADLFAQQPDFGVATVIATTFSGE
jgi:quinol monooxygenase YgiN